MSEHVRRAGFSKVTAARRGNNFRQDVRIRPQIQAPMRKASVAAQGRSIRQSVRCASLISEPGRPARPATARHTGRTCCIASSRHHPTPWLLRAMRWRRQSRDSQVIGRLIALLSRRHLKARALRLLHDFPGRYHRPASRRFLPVYESSVMNHSRTIHSTSASYTVQTWREPSARRTGALDPAKRAQWHWTPTFIDAK